MSQKISLLDDASLPSNIEGLEEELLEVKHRQQLCQSLISDLMNKEDHTKGVFFAKEIHEARQLKMMLQYQHDLRTAKANRLRLGND